MPDNTRGTRPPAGFVSLSQPRWRELCAALAVNPNALELRSGETVIGWRAPRMWYVDPNGYRAVIGTWPPGYWPE